MVDQISAIVVRPVFFKGRNDRRAPQAALEEAVGLAAAINLHIAYAACIEINKPRPATLFGAGQIESLTDIIQADSHIQLVIVDGVLTPVQHRNLEKELNCKVLDRTALILEIFGERAHTREGKLQVELAHLSYQRSRLVRSWTHLERQRGGAGFLGGPGERQIESDRRQLADKIDRLKKQLEDVRRTRNLQRRQRRRAPHPVIALAGYTNAGKSTLFNHLTNATVEAKDLLFATLDPTMRSVDLPSMTRVIFSDTVGFISDLPTQLVAAFRATLEEVLEANIILHVRDISHEDSDAQRQDVLEVLNELGISEDDTRPMIEVWNKADLLSREDQTLLQHIALARNEKAEGTLHDPYIIVLSAVTGQGLERLFDFIDEVLTARHLTVQAKIPTQNGAAIAWLFQHGDVLQQDMNETEVIMTVRLSAKSAGQFEKQFSLELLAGLDEEGNQFGMSFAHG
ncbi:MAG: GTPase HflX [bacterium]